MSEHKVKCLIPPTAIMYAYSASKAVLHTIVTCSKLEKLQFMQKETKRSLIDLSLIKMVCKLEYYDEYVQKKLDRVPGLLLDFQEDMAFR